ncbi:MAG: DUF4870 domain-containing protein [Bacteroidota bacterium]
MNEIESNYHPVPQPDDIPVREREDAMGGYLMMFASIAAGLPLPIINLIAAVIYFYLNKGKSRFIKFHAYQSLVSQIPTTLINAGLVFWTVRLFFYQSNTFDEVFSIGSEYEIYWGYLFMVLFANLIYMIFSLVAAFKARKGQFFYFLFFGKMSYHYAYLIRVYDGKQVVNQPPAM